MNVAEIERSLRLLVSPGSTFEVRALGHERGREVTLSGYFTDPSAAASAIASTCRGMTGIYTTLNPVRPELLARCANRIAPARKNGTTSDHHVLKRTRLLIDVDGVPVAGISASDAEHQAAIDLASEIEFELAQRGWPQPLRGDSGNGAHLDYAIDLPADDSGLVARVLDGMQKRFGATVVTAAGEVTLKIDTSNKNPARITKIFGTPARKGDNVPERPHRLSKIISAPDILETVSREQLEQFADEYAPIATPAASQRPVASTPHLKALDVQDWLSKHGISVRNVNQSWTGKQGPGTCFELSECPQNSDHNRGEAYVVQHASGAISAGCQHQSCTWDWQWLRERYEPRALRTQQPVTAEQTPSAKSERTQEQKDEIARKREEKRQRARQESAVTDGHAGYGPRGGYRLTDLGNARRFADMNSDRFRFVKPWNTWLTWDGRRWKKNELGSEKAAAKQVVAQIYQDVGRLAIQQARAVTADGAKTSDSTLIEEITKWAKDSATAARIAAMVKLAESEPELAASTKIWDSDHWLLNCANGTVDLRSGELQPHRQADMLTMLAPLDYDPDATAPRFEQFLERVQPDAESRRWIQKYLGYSLTGDVREQCLAFFFGSGSNGKSVLLDLVLNILGDYGLRAAPDLVLAKHGEAHPTELADLEGRRLVVCSEIEQGRAWAESLIKRITGDQTITARRMRQDFFTFTATHKLIVAANTLPTVRGTDHGIWRRMRLVPWEVTIPDEQQDRTLPQQLLEEEGPGILAWLVRGCIAWQNQGLGGAAAIARATIAYRSSQDVIGRWIEDRCEIDPETRAPAKELYESFKSWCEEEGMQAWLRKTWKERLLERPRIEEGKMGDGSIRALKGIRVRGAF